MEAEPAVVVAFPLRGEWTALHTPAERVPSHGTDYFGQRYAFDFARLRGVYRKAYRKPIWQHLLGLVRAEDCYGWGAPVCAPFAGEVIAVGEDWPERVRLNLLWDLLSASFCAPAATPADYRPLTGNYILLQGQPGVALLAHLRRSSIGVRPGQFVAEGDPLAEVGNSGNSTLPHLHFQLMDGRDPFQAAGVLCKFRRYERWRNETWEEMRDSIPQALEPIRLL